MRPVTRLAGRGTCRCYCLLIHTLIAVTSIWNFSIFDLQDEAEVDDDDIAMLEEQLREELEIGELIDNDIAEAQAKQDLLSSRVERHLAVSGEAYVQTGCRWTTPASDSEVESF